AISPTSWLKWPMVVPRSTATCPVSGSSSLTIMRKIVDLPEPFGPTSPTFSPRNAANDASMNKIWWPCWLGTPSSGITLVPSLRFCVSPFLKPPAHRVELPFLERSFLQLDLAKEFQPLGDVGDPDRLAWKDEIRVVATQDLPVRAVVFAFEV